MIYYTRSCRELRVSCYLDQVVSEGGEAWQGTHQPASVKHKHDIIKVKRINNIHRAVAVTCDAKGEN